MPSINLKQTLNMPIGPKPLSYWLIAISSIILGMYCGEFLDKRGVWLGLRYRLYECFEWVVPHQPQPTRTALVLIDDNEYWKGRLARRVPIHRDYLADLLRSVSACDPAVIALDFDLRSPVADGTLKDNPEYAQETAALLAALSDVSKRATVVLPATIEPTSGGGYLLDSAVYDGIPLKKGLLQIGYIQPPFDARKVPLAVTLLGRGPLDSFAESIVRAVNENKLSDIHKGDSLPFGTFMQEDRFRYVLAGDLLGNPRETLCEPLRHNIAIIGAAWHRHSFNEGELIDSHITPVGYMRGTFVHANYVEALLDSRTYSPLGERYNRGIEFIFASIVAVVLALRVSTWKRFLYAVTLCVGMMLLSYLFWQNLGIFFDFFFPVVFLLVHVFLDYFREFRADALRGRSMHA